MSGGRKALISISEKEEIKHLASELLSLGFEIIATSGTADYLSEKGFSVKRISEITGMSESKELKTIHPEIFRMIFSGEIELVAVNLYPFKLHPSLENIDIGGVALIRAAAKNYRRVVVLPSKEYYKWAVNALDDLNLRRLLAREAFRITSEYDSDISRWFDKQLDEESWEGENETS